MADEMRTKDKAGKPAGSAAIRRERLAKELRANLLRRKEQARALAEKGDEPEGDET
jgi:hypothetical protein